MYGVCVTYMLLIISSSVRTELLWRQKLFDRPNLPLVLSGGVYVDQIMCGWEKLLVDSVLFRNRPICAEGYARIFRCKSWVIALWIWPFTISMSPWNITPFHQIFFMFIPPIVPNTFLWPHWLYFVLRGVNELIWCNLLWLVADRMQWPAYVRLKNRTKNKNYKYASLLSVTVFQIRLNCATTARPIQHGLQLF